LGTDWASCRQPPLLWLSFGGKLKLKKKKGKEKTPCVRDRHKKRIIIVVSNSGNKTNKTWKQMTPARLLAHAFAAPRGAADKLGERGKGKGGRRIFGGCMYFSAKTDDTLI